MQRAVSALFLLGCALGNPVPLRAQDADPRPTVLHLSETAERTVARDALRAELRAEEISIDPHSVQTAINRRMAAALERAKQAQGVRVETGSYSVGEERAPNGPARWRGIQSLILTGKDAETILKLAGTLQSEGLAMSSLGYEVSPESLRGVQDELTAEALAALDRRAAAIAASMHLNVLRYRDLRVGNTETEGRPMPRLAATMAAAAPPVAEAGEAVAHVTVEAELLLGPSQP